MVLMHEEWYQNMIKERWTELYESGVFERAYDMITTDSEQYEKAFEENSKKWGEAFKNESILNELCAGAASCKIEKQAADYLRSWLAGRVAFMDSQWHK